jgi:hypothetical protein
MVPELLLLLVALLTLFNAGLQYYTTVSTYPLFSDLTPEAFVAYHEAYQRRLPAAIYIPYTLLMLATLLLLAVRPPSVEPIWVLVLLILNGSIMAVSLRFAAPIHARLDQHGKNPDDLRRLRRFNLPRLIAVSLSSVIVCGLLAQTLMA